MVAEIISNCLEVLDGRYLLVFNISSIVQVLLKEDAGKSLPPKDNDRLHQTLWILSPR